MQPEDIKRQRAALGFTQKELAEAIGMSRKAIVEMENGRAPIELRTVLAIRYLRMVQAAANVDR